MKTIVLILKSMRPLQWTKNLFVLAPLLFAKKLFDPFSIILAFTGFFSFSLLSATVYIINDILDMEKDKYHPIKKLRPVASGALSINIALVSSLIFFSISLIIAYFLKKEFFLVCAFYFLLNISYSFYLKKLPFLDIFSIAMGFLLRIAAGCFAIRLSVYEISPWILICTFLISVFLGFGKRKHELIFFGKHSFSQRESLSKYSLKHINIALYISAIVTIISYIFYTISSRTIAFFGTWKLIFTTPFVVFGILRYLWILNKYKQGVSPTDYILKDYLFLGNIILWGIIAICIIYLK